MVPKLLRNMRFWGKYVLRPWDWGGVGVDSRFPKTTLPTQAAPKRSVSLLEFWAFLCSELLRAAERAAVRRQARLGGSSELEVRWL
eukprot:3572883-Amphidinium_carterae.1